MSTDLGLRAATAFRPSSTVGELSTVLRDAILSGELPQGTQLRETAVATQFGVGRSVLREALRELVAEGLVTHKVNHGIFVTVIPPGEIHDIYRAREVIEVGAVEMMNARPADEVDFGPLEEIVAQMQQIALGRTHLDDDQVRQAFRLDLRFHQIMVEMSGSTRINRLYRSLNAEMSMYFANVPTFKPEYLTQHEELLQALRHRDESSIAATRLHLHRPVDQLPHS
jgi:DNA-binding GntR family transcriptional regulator